MKQSGESWDADLSICTDTFHGRKTVGGDHLGAKHTDEEGMWVDAAARGASRERRKVGAHGDIGM
jgi:hypothetical protein